jgi:hypothetical protein
MVDSGNALSLLYHVLSSPDPFAQCLAPKFSSEKTELRYHTLMQLGQLLRELRLLAGEWTSRDRGFIFPDRDGVPFSNQTFTAWIKGH